LYGEIKICKEELNETLDMNKPFNQFYEFNFAKKTREFGGI